MSAIVRRIRARGNPDHDYWQPGCECGWAGALYSNRTVEGRDLAERHADQHRCRLGRVEEDARRLRIAADCVGGDAQ